MTTIPKKITNYELRTTNYIVEGNLIAPDITTEMLAGTIKGQAPEDFNFTKTDKLADEIAIAWGDAKAYWAAFQRALARLPENDLATTVTREQWAVPLLRSLGYDPVYTAKAETIDGQTFALSHRAGVLQQSKASNAAPAITNYELRITNYPPIHIVGCGAKLEQRPPSGTPRLSAHALMQEYLNRTEHLWGIVTNGLQWRLLRDCSLMTRLTYIEFDLEQILNNENFAEFGLFYRLFHRSRLPQGADDADECLLEYYHQEAIQQGGRVRDRLRDGVEKALVLLGTGFLQHPNNEKLRQQVEAGVQSNNYELRITNYEFYRQLLLLIYRLLFLMVAEARNLLIGSDKSRTENQDSEITNYELRITNYEEKARIYLEYYSVTRLRNLAERPSYRREGFQDLWQGLRVTFRLFDENWRGEVLGLSPLNGDLFGSKTLKHLDEYAIDNHELLQAIRQLSLYEQKGQSRRVNYAALDVEELGSVYESLLDFHPQIQARQGIYEFQLVTGSDRKTTGSYYTPPELVGQLIKSALEPVIEEKIRNAKFVIRNSENNYELRTTNYELEKALLSIKVCDPACGSGHFLLAAARRIGKELAIVRTGEAQPGVEPLRKAIRDVVQNCIYGVDLNPLAVDLCKVALWIEGFNRGLPLNFLDHRIKCGNSLVGVLDLACLDEGIPDEAFKPVTGDDKQLASRWKKENKKQRETDLQGQLSLDFDGNLEQDRSHYAQTAIEVGAIAEITTGDVRQKQVQYQQSRQDKGWWRDYSACNLWTAAFFMPLTEQNLDLLPTTAALTRLIRNSQFVIRNSEGNCELKGDINELVKAANRLAQEKRFFHWALEFPEVFNPEPTNYELRTTNYELGFDCVLGNPPWERIKLQEKEFFASRSAEIANAANKAGREKLIKELPKINSALAQAFEDAKHDADAQSKFIRESARFPLTAVGDINTYAVFAETTKKIISPSGRVGIILPVGIATDDTTKKYFGDLIQSQSLASLTGFENEAFIFPSVHHAFKFCTLVVAGSSNKVNQAKFTFFCRHFTDTNNPQRQFNLTSEEIALINPNTLTCPIFRTRADADLTKKIYQRVPVLENEQTGSNPWDISFMAMFHMANDSGLFINEAGNGLVPLYEAKMFHQFDHRYSTYEGATQANLNAGILPQLSEEIKQNPNLTVQPRYWVERAEVENRLCNSWTKNWLIAFRSITNAVSERTAIFSILPKVAVGHSAPLMTLGIAQSSLICCLQANLSSLIFDFITRQKLGGTNFSLFILKQLPVIPPEAYTPEDIEFISSRVLELVYTAWDMQPFAQDIWNDSNEKMRELIVKQWQANQTASHQTPENSEFRIPNSELPPFIWNSERRALLRAELDAYYAKLYGLTRDELRYILDPADVYGSDFPSETFRVLKNNEIKQFGEYRTQRLVLEAWDRMFG